MKRRSEVQPYRSMGNPFARMPRCGAKTRAGSLCRRVAGPKKRCYFHGGAPGSGAPQGNRNRLVHGRYSAAAIAQRKAVHALLRQAKAHLKTMLEGTNGVTLQPSHVSEV
jgi:hypothetical protein